MREPWPPLPPGGYRAPDTPPFGGFAEQVILYGLLGTGTAGLLAWTTGCCETALLTMVGTLTVTMSWRSEGRGSTACPGWWRC